MSHFASEKFSFCDNRGRNFYYETDVLEQAGGMAKMAGADVVSPRICRCLTNRCNVLSAQEYFKLVTFIPMLDHL